MRYFLHVRTLVLTAALTVLPLAAFGATPWELQRLHEVLGIESMLEIMREEGLMQSEDLRDDMFPGRGGAGWDRIVSRIYDTERMSGIFRDVMDTELVETDVTPLIAFFEAPVGVQIIELELEGRRAMLDPAVEEAALVGGADLQETDAVRFELIDDFVSANDLIEFNVMGAMNSSVAFLKGLSDGGGFNMPEGEILSDVWAQEPELRDETVEWMYGYLTMAYGPLADDDLKAYTELTETPAGRDLNRALFAAFDALFLDVSYALGTSASTFMISEDL